LLTSALDGDEWSASGPRAGGTCNSNWALRVTKPNKLNQVATLIFARPLDSKYLMDAAGGLDGAVHPPKRKLTNVSAYRHACLACVTVN
jgi:hypothetical protein